MKYLTLIAFAAAVAALILWPGQILGVLLFVWVLVWFAERLTVSVRERRL